MIATRNNFTIKDNDSEFAKYLPNKWMEPLTILARIKGYVGIDNYVIHLIELELESIRDGGQGIQDLGEYVMKYIEEVIGPGNEEEEESNNENVSKFVKQVNEEYHHDMKHTTAVDDKEKEDLK